MRPAVTFEHVWKRFRRGERHNSLRDLVPALARRALPGTESSSDSEEDFWALRDVSFEVASGEAFGIIGPNGAGKSTTLKLLTRILKPTRGSCAVRGRIGALIEVAAGFHPDLTGRENIFLQGAIMGMKRTEIAQRLDAIVDFAGVGDFIETPVKRYSSGMNARLGFAIAAHLDPEVLIIDEVLSVGDMAFQERCIERMVEFKRQGTSIVFVSHNLQAVTMLCDRAIFIRGSAVAIGPSHEVVHAYTRQSLAPSQESNRPFVLKSSSLETALGRTEAIPPGTPLVHRATYESSQAFNDLTFGFAIRRSTDMFLVYDAHFTAAEAGIPVVEAGETLTIEFQFTAHLTRGVYHVECGIVDNLNFMHLNHVEPIGSFSIDESRTWGGVANVGGSAVAQISRPLVHGTRS